MSAPAIRRVLFTGDFLRPAEFQERPTQSFNIRWIADLLGEQIALAAGLHTDQLYWCGEGLNQGHLDREAVRGIYRALGHDDVTVANWVQLIEAETLPPVLESFLRGLTRNALVVGFELPVMLKRFLERTGGCYVDCVIHPVRFMDDIFLGMTSNHPGVREAIAAHALPHEAIRVAAGITRAAAARLFRFETRGRAVLIVGQVATDRTQISEGRFRGFANFGAEILQLTRDYDDVLIKEHPLDPHNPGVRFVEGLSTKVRKTGANIYSLLAMGDLAEIVSLSSSVGIEAPYFGKKSRFLLHRPMRLDGDPADVAVPASAWGEQGYIAVYDDFLSPDFWRTILAPLGLPVTRPSHYKVAVKPNRLRSSLASFWGYDAIDLNRVRV